MSDITPILPARRKIGKSIIFKYMNTTMSLHVESPKSHRVFIKRKICAPSEQLSLSSSSSSTEYTPSTQSQQQEEEQQQQQQQQYDTKRRKLNSTSPLKHYQHNLYKIKTYENDTRNLIKACEKTIESVMESIKEQIDIVADHSLYLKEPTSASTICGICNKDFKKHIVLEKVDRELDILHSCNECSSKLCYRCVVELLQIVVNEFNDMNEPTIYNGCSIGYKCPTCRFFNSNIASCIKFPCKSIEYTTGLSTIPKNKVPYNNKYLVTSAGIKYKTHDDNLEDYHNFRDNILAEDEYNDRICAQEEEEKNKKDDDTNYNEEYEVEEQSYIMDPIN